MSLLHVLTIVKDLLFFFAKGELAISIFPVIMALLPLASGNAVSNFWDYFLHVFVPEILKAHFMAVLGVSNDL